MNDRVKPAEVIAEALGRAVLPGRRYWTELPTDLAPWYCYTTNGGHSIAVLLACQAEDHAHGGADPAAFLISAPVRAVLRAGWSKRADGFVVSDLPHGRQLMVATESHLEFDTDALAGAPPYRYAVGELYYPGTTRYPDNVAQWVLTDCGIQLALFYRSPFAAETDAVRRGQPGFALVAGEHALLLGYRFTPGIPWSPAPWQACGQPLPVGVPMVWEDGFLPVLVILVDSTTGLVRALRQTRWSNDFLEHVRAAVRTQVLNGSTDQQGIDEIHAWYQRNPTAEGLLGDATAMTDG